MPTTKTAPDREPALGGAEGRRMTTQEEPKPRLDRPGIVAELRRRGLTMAALDRQHGFASGTCRQGLLGQSRKGSQAIAEALGRTVKELWPDCYLRVRSQAEPTAAHGAAASPKRIPNADNTRAA